MIAEMNVEMSSERAFNYCTISVASDVQCLHYYTALIAALEFSGKQLHTDLHNIYRWTKIAV